MPKVITKGSMHIGYCVASINAEELTGAGTDKSRWEMISNILESASIQLAGLGCRDGFFYATRLRTQMIEHASTLGRPDYEEIRGIQNSAIIGLNEQMNLLETKATL